MADSPLSTNPTPPSSTTEDLAEVDPRGPVFISYRQSDGSEVVERLAWELRAHGVPVWQDRTDLPPGDTRRRLEEALASGLSGAVLFITPEIEHSTYVRALELPRLLQLEETTTFTLALASIVERREDCHLDYGAPDRFFAPTRSLSDFKQLPARSEAEIAEVACQVAFQRMAVLRSLRIDPLVVAMQTRHAPTASVERSDVVVRTRPPRDGERLPPPATWASLCRGLSCLPQLVERSGASSVLVSGGGHLTAAFALGAALPVTTSWPVIVLDQFGGRWEASPLAEPQGLVSTKQRLDGAAGAAVFVDLVEKPPPSDAFERAVAHSNYGSALRISLKRRPRVDPAAGYATASAIADEIRSAAHHLHDTRVALFLRCPFAVAVLLGRLLNTLRVDLFEWDDSCTPDAYVRVITVQSGLGGSPITAIHVAAEENR